MKNYFNSTNVQNGIIVKAEDLVMFEKVNKFSLPENYKKLLIFNNGGHLYENNTFTFNWKQDTININIEEIYSFNLVKNKFVKVINNKEEIEFENHGDAIIIGNTDFRDLLLIGIKEYNYGIIYFSPSVANVFDYIEDCTYDPIFPVIEISSDIFVFLDSLH